ncbi:MAG: pentapeptide repeat-containing protein [Bacteroidetes bacterium]|nr:pentapeptide repeat-containing protein [Bacteroidota bacterium]
METNIIGNKIAEARKKINLSQAQLAERLFISQQAVGKWERGESIPDMVTCNKLAEIFGVDLNYFSENFPSVIKETGNKEVFKNAEDIQQTKQEDERDLLNDFSGSNLKEVDFAGVKAHKRKFNGSTLRGSNFEGADLTGSAFTASDASEANFDGTDLTDCSLSATDLTNASFVQTILVRTEFTASNLAGAKFTDAKLLNVKLVTTDLRKTIFNKCVFNGVDFKHSDLRGLCFDEQTFADVKFDKAALDEATFKGATLKNVSFRPTFALTNKYYRAIKKICFDGAMMDKLTYASLKGMGADLLKVTII